METLTQIRSHGGMLVGLTISPHTNLQCQTSTNHSKLPQFACSSLHVIFTLFFSSSILILLVFTHQVIHVTLCFGELHLIHAFPSVPMEECFAPEHSSKKLGNTLEHPC